MDLQNIYDTNKNLQKSDVKVLVNWMENQPHLPKTDERMIIFILIACEMNLAKTKQRIEYYYTVRTSFPAVFSERDPESPKNLKGLEVCLFEPMPQLSPEGHAVFYNKLIDASVENYDFCTFVKLMDMRIHALLHEVGCVQGFQMIVDMQGLTLKHVHKSGIWNSQTAVGYLKGIPIRLKAVHILNPTYFLKGVLALMYPLISTKLKQSIKVHNSFTLSEALPKYCIPDELNGTGGSTQKLHKSFIEAIRRNRDYFLDDEHFKADESKRVKKGILKRFAV